MAKITSLLPHIQQNNKDSVRIAKLLDSEYQSFSLRPDHEKQHLYLFGITAKGNARLLTVASKVNSGGKRGALACPVPRQHKRMYLEPKTLGYVWKEGGL